jgi:hypothetical protein
VLQTLAGDKDSGANSSPGVEAVRWHHGEIEIIREAEAVDYRKPLAIIQDVQSSTSDKIEGTVIVSAASVG